VKIAIVHDHLMQRGGSERVFYSMATAFPSAELYTAFYDPARTFPELRELDIKTLPVSRLPVVRHSFHAALPLLPRAFSSLTVDADVTLCGSSGWSHGTTILGRRIVYWYSPAKWLYQTDQYFGGRWSARRVGLTALRPYLHRWDQRVARRGGRHLVISTAQQIRLREVYGIEAEVLPAPHTLDPYGERAPVDGVERGYFLCVSRLVGHKNVDVVIEAFRGLNETLVVVGTGPEETRLKALAPDNVRLVGTVTDAQIRWLYEGCKGVVSASYEDFGLTPLEGALFGKPSIALRWGGFLDTIVEDETGVLFARVEPAEVASAVHRLNRLDISPARLKDHADIYSEERFIKRLSEVVHEELSYRA
jgi:glycosyltransferase involved in cell wall biosynthesis